MRTTARTARAALAKARRWWVEILVAAILGLIASAPTHGAAFLAGFMAAFIVVGWLMCMRHKRLPLHEKVDRIGAGITELLDDVRSRDSERDDEEPERPTLTLVHSQEQ